MSESKHSDKELAKGSSDNTKKKSSITTSSTKTPLHTDYLLIAKDIILKIYFYIKSFVIQFVLPQLFKLTGMINEKYVNKQYNTDIKMSDLKQHKHYIEYLPLAMELVLMMIHGFMVRMWLIVNFVTNLYNMYAELNDKSDGIIKNMGYISIGSGVLMILFYSGEIGFVTLPLIAYLINRTAKNIFDKGL